MSKMVNLDFEERHKDYPIRLSKHLTSYYVFVKNLVTKNAVLWHYFSSLSPSKKEEILEALEQFLQNDLKDLEMFANYSKLLISAPKFDKEKFDEYHLNFVKKINNLLNYLNPNEKFLLTFEIFIIVRILHQIISPKFLTNFESLQNTLEILFSGRDFRDKFLYLDELLNQKILKIKSPIENKKLTYFKKEVTKFVDALDVDVIFKILLTETLLLFLEEISPPVLSKMALSEYVILVESTAV